MAKQVSGKRVEFDALRALALCRVFLWHSTSYKWVTWVAALPVMVLITGMLTGGALARDGVARTALRRLRRLLVPFWGFSIASWLVMGLLGRELPWASAVWWVVPLSNPTGTDWESGWLSTPLWYIRLLVWMYLAMPLIFRLSKRIPKSASALAGVSVVVLELLVGNRFWAVQDLALFAVFMVIGLAIALGTLPEFGRSWSPLILLGASGATVWVIARGTSGVVNDSHSLHLFVGIATVGLAGLLVEVFRGAGPMARSVIDWFARYSLTVYLWHSMAILAVMKSTEGWRASLGDNLAVRAGVVVASGALVWIATPVLAVLERLGQGVRAFDAGIGRRHAARLSVGAVLMYGLAAGAPTSQAAAYELKPPSQAPLVNEAAGDEEVHIEVPRDLTLASEDLHSTEPTINAPRARELSRAPGLEDSAPALGAQDQLRTALQDQLDAYARSTGAAGVGVLVVRPGHFSWFGGAGAVPFAADEQMGVMSLTKTYTAALVFRAAEEGLINLAEPVGQLQVAPWFTPSTDTTWVEFLAHQSGLINYRDTSAYASNPDAINDWEPALRAVLAEGRNFEPGEGIEYSSTNYIVLGVALEELYGEDIESLIEDALLEPLGLDATHVSRPGPREPNTGTAGVTTSISDLARWGISLWVEHAVLGEASGMLNAAVNRKWLVGPGSEGFCPCTKNTVSAIGYSGGTNTMRWYPNEEVLVVFASRESLWQEGVPPRVDALIERLVKTATDG